MHGPRNSILKRWHALKTTPAGARRIWQQPYWQEKDGCRDISCAICPRFDDRRAACSIAFGTPLRKCAAAAIEAHLNDCKGMQVLEIGYGRWMLARNLIRRSGGKWSGIDPGQPPEKRAGLGRGGHGQAADIPFPDDSFDMVIGIQTFEHLGQRYGGREPSEYAACMVEIQRVLKPGGRLYLDSPMHFHGHEMFIMGDVPRIQNVLEEAGWKDIVVECWRREYAPLEKYPPSAKVQREWPVEITSYSQQAIEKMRAEATVWLLTLNACNPGRPAVVGGEAGQEP